MRSILAKLRSNGFIKSLIVLISGSVFAQLITIICSPFMTRLYSTEQIGDYSLVLAAIGMFGSVIALRLDAIIVSEKDDDRVFGLVKLCFVLSAIISVIVGAAYAIYYWITSYSLSQIIICSISICFLLFLTGISNTLISYNNRKKEYNLMSGVSVIRSIVKEVVMLLAFFLGPSVFLLIISQILGTIFGVSKQAKSLKRDSDNYRKIVVIKKDFIFSIFKSEYKQVLFSSPALFVNNFSYSSINYFIKGLYGSSVLGLYSISYKLLGLPMSLISMNASKVYMEKATSEYHSKNNYRSTFTRTAAFLLAISVPMTIIIMVFSPFACKMVYGDEYYYAGIYVRYLAPMFGIRFIVSPLTVGCIISKKQNNELILQSAFMLSGIVSFLVSKFFGLSVGNYLVLISALYSIVYVVYFIYLFHISKGNVKTIDRD